jgi:hypothetical protein
MGEDADQSVCFLDDGFNNWGWTNMIGADAFYTWPLHAGASGCIATPENRVGTVYLHYAEGDLEIEYEMFFNFALDQVHINVGCDKYAVKPNGQQTISPGQYTYVNEALTMSSGMSITFTGVQGPVWVIAHAVSCEVPGGSFTTVDPEYLDLNCTDAKRSIARTPPGEASNAIEMSIYPNPFINATNIEFEVPVTGKVFVEVYTMLGEKLATLYNTTAQSGHDYTVTFHATEVKGPGMYLCVIRTKRGYIVKPVMVMQ